MTNGKNIYKIHFDIKFYCGGVVSFANDCHVTVMGYTREDAISKFKKGLQIGGPAGPECGEAVTIKEVEWIELT